MESTTGAAASRTCSKRAVGAAIEIAMINVTALREVEDVQAHSAVRSDIRAPGAIGIGVREQPLQQRGDALLGADGRAGGKHDIHLQGGCAADHDVHRSRRLEAGVGPKRFSELSGVCRRRAGLAWQGARDRTGTGYERDAFDSPSASSRFSP